MCHPLHSGRSIAPKEITIAIHVRRRRLALLIDQQRSRSLVTYINKREQQLPRIIVVGYSSNSLLDSNHVRRLLTTTTDNNSYHGSSSSVTLQLIPDLESHSSVTHGRFAQQPTTIATTDHRRRLLFN
jgi:hypothetical protein